MSGTIGEETAIQSLRSGANDYILKSNLSRLPTAVQRALKDAAEGAQRLETEEALRLRDRAVEASVNPVLIVSATDPAMPIVYVNHAFEQVTGYSRDEMIGQNCRLLQGTDRNQPELDKIRRAIAEQTDGRALLRNYRKDGSLFWNMLYVTPVRDPRSNQVTHFVGVQHDITEIKRYQEELEHQANHDALTGLANRNLLRDRLEQGLRVAHRYGRACSVAFIDLDNFKLINDSLGHDIGDQVLKIVGERLAACIREGDTVARLGGDEFVLLVTEHGRDSGRLRVAQRVIAAIAQPFAIDAAGVQGDVLDRHRELPARRHRRRHAAAQRRHRDVPGEGPRPQHLPALLGRDERESGRAPDAGDGPLERARAQRVPPPLPAEGRPRRRDGSSVSKRCCDGSIRPRE